MDSVYQHHCVKDTFLLMPSGYKAHALYLYAPKSTDRTAIVVHGYQGALPRECSTSPISTIMIWGIMCSFPICMDMERVRAFFFSWDVCTDGVKQPVGNCQSDN